MRILITGAGSTMGQSIYGALLRHNFNSTPEVHFGNSDRYGAGMYFDDQILPVVARPLLPLASSENYEDFVIKYVEKQGIDIVYSGTQHELLKLSRLRDKYGSYATLTNSITELCLDKHKSINFLKGKGVRVPGSQKLIDFIINPLIRGPLVAKPNTSSGSREVKKYVSGEALAVDCTDRNRYDDVVVQQQLFGDEYTCACYVDRYTREKNVICMTRTLTVDGASSWGKIVHDEEIEHYIHQVTDAFIEAGLDFGNINVQLIKDELGPCLFEVNGRLSSTEAPKARFGFNSTAAFYCNIIEKSPYAGFKVLQTGEFLRYYREVYWNVQ